MNLLFNIVLFIHITGGTLGLLAGTYVAFAKKGDRRHKLIGKVFAVSMIGAGVCSFVLATLHHNNFLFAVGVFTIYMASTGWRYLYLKDIAKGQKPIWIDWTIMSLMFLGSIWFLIMGLRALFTQQYFGIVILIFAWRGLSFVFQDYKIYKGKITVKNYWLLHHFQRMMGAYIASWTAFAVVNFSNSLSFIPWLLPSAVFVPLIIKWSKKYAVKAVVGQ